MKIGLKTVLISEKLVKNWYQNARLKYYFELSALRGFAALLIFLYHFGEYFIPRNIELRFLRFDFNIFLSAGHAGVSMFFVLSGFLIFLSFASKKITFKNYLLNRILRIAPLAIFFVLLIALLLGPAYWQTSLGQKNIWFHLLFIQNFSLDTFQSHHPGMWILTIELLFYLIFPLLFYWGRVSKRRFLLIIISLMLVSFAWRLGVFWQFGNDWSWEDLEHFRRYVFVSEQLWGRFADFGVGILAAVFYSSKSAKQISSKSAGVISTLSFTLLIYLLSIFADLGGEFRRIWYWQVFLYFLVASVFAALIVGLLLWREKKLKRYLLKVFEPLGTISYSFFLWHFLIIVFLADIPKYTQRLPWDFTWLSSFLTSNLEVKAFFIALALSIILSIITYYAIEKPFLKLKKR